MANCNSLFNDFNEALKLTSTKETNLKKSRDNIRETIRKFFKINHPNYQPRFFMQGSYKMRTVIRISDDTCDIDDGVYFKDNPDNESCTTIQSWVFDAVKNITNDVRHRNKCITVNYANDYNIDLPVYLFNEEKDIHPLLAVKNKDWRMDDPKEMMTAFNKEKNGNDQLVRMIRYLKAWGDNKGSFMPCGLAMTVLAMNNYQKNDRDDISLKYTLIEIENDLKNNFSCIVPAVPNDDLFEAYEYENKFMNLLKEFIDDAKKAIDEEKNQEKASLFWRKHLGDRFPKGENKEQSTPSLGSLGAVIGSSRPYYDDEKL